MELRTSVYKEQSPQLELRGVWASRHPILAIVLYSILYLAIAAALTWFFSSTGVPVDADKKTVCLLLILLTGATYMITFPAQLDFMQVLKGRIGIIYVSLALLIGLTTFIIFSLSGLNDIQLSLAVTCSFLFPYTALQCWNYFNSAFTKTIPLWFIPEQVTDKRVALIFLNSLQLQVILKKKSYNKTATSFPITAPATMPLGKTFTQLLKDQADLDEAIEITDGRKRPYGWRFIQKKPFSSSILNPEATLREINLRPQAVILVERVYIK